MLTDLASALPASMRLGGATTAKVVGWHGAAAVVILHMERDTACGAG